MLFGGLVGVTRVSANASMRHVSMADGLPTNTVRSIVQDKSGFLWFGSDNGLCRYDGYEVRLYRNPHLGVDQFVSTLGTFEGNLLVGSSHGAYLFDCNKGSFKQLHRDITALVSAFSVDADGLVWISTNGQGVFCYRPQTATCRRYPLPQTGGKVSSVFVDGDNQVWALARQPKGLFHYNRGRNTFGRAALKGDNLDFDGMCMAQGIGGGVLIGTWNRGLLAVGRDGTMRQLLNPIRDGTGTHIHTIFGDAPGKVLLGCDEGLLRFDLQHNTVEKLTGQGSVPATGRFVYAVTRDREGGLWMGTFYGGVTYFSPMGQRFASYHADGGLLRGNVVSRFVEDERGRIWMATDDGGLGCFDMAQGKFVDFPGRRMLMEMNTHGLWAEGNSLWVGTYGNGLIRMNTSTGSVKAYTLDGARRSVSCYAVMRDRRGRLWAGSMDNACLHDAETDAFRVVKALGGLTVDIMEDARGNLWFATQGKGLWRLTPGGKWRHYVAAAGTRSLGSNQVNCVREDNSGRLYVATEDGLYEYLYKSDGFRRIVIASGSQNFSGLVINQDEMWLASPIGLIRYVAGRQPQIYNRFDGIVAAPFQPNACMMASDGRVWFGSVDGINAFYPYKIETNRATPSVVITGIERPGRQDAKGDSLLQEAIAAGESIDLGHSDNMFVLHFSALSFVSPEKNRYAYMLKGFDDEWIYSGADHKATYTNIPPGTYTFMVKATNNDGVWTETPASIRITVHPPFYWSLPAKIIYLLVLMGVVYYYIHLRLSRAERRHRRELQAINDHKEQELRDARLHFFTMIAHEIRTPVTLIIGPLENLKAQWEQVSVRSVASEAVSDTIEVIDRNAHRLLELVNQLLDFNKVQHPGISLQLQVVNIPQLVRAVAERFEPTLRHNHATLQTDCPEDDFTAVVDSEGLTKIISNLMTNATKYTKSRVRLSCLRPDDTHFCIEVEDDGVGISREEQDKIFGEFYQARDNKPGTGIGLSIVRSIVKAHHGEVEVQSEPDRGALFMVTLPLSQPDAVVGAPVGTPLVADTDKPVVELLSPKGLEEHATPAVLVVEDDEDLLHFLRSSFKDHYQVYTADNGLIALQLLQTHVVSLIVSDWMMPEMDGAELCRRVRSDSATSHIPFIMLTAKTDDDSKTQSMDCGADIFIEKPFSMKYLTAAIRNLIEMRRQLQEKFSHSPMEPITRIAHTTVDNAFLSKLSRIVEDNMDSSELNVAFLARQMGVSRSGLFAKIKALADMTPNEMIQVIRLKKAAQLLRSGQYRVNEVCYQVGFGSPSYFAKCFQKQFGMKPTEFVEAAEDEVRPSI